MMRVRVIKQIVVALLAVAAPLAVWSQRMSQRLVSLGARQFLVHVPVPEAQVAARSPRRGHDAARLVPAVMLLHGQGLSPYYMDRLVGFQPLLAKHNWIGISPFGWSTTNRTGAAACCDASCNEACCEAGLNMTQDKAAQCGWNVDRAEGQPDDTAFLVHAAEWAVANLNVDPSLVFAAGFSAGAMMVNRLGCDGPGPFAALAPVEGDLMDNSTCNPAPTKKLPWLGFCGSVDFVCQAMGTSYKSTVAGWAERNGCDMEKQPVPTRVTRTTHCQTYLGCNASVQACTVDAMGHHWPGHGEPDEKDHQSEANVDASTFIFDFFQRVANSSRASH